VNGGTLVEHFIKPAAYGTSSPALRWRIPTASGCPPPASGSIGTAWGGEHTD
jgi:hypothetical protein